MKQFSNAIAFARTQRKEQTPAEKALWSELRGKKMHGLKFLRQHPLHYELEGQAHYFIADFYCASAKLVIEVDGAIHDRQQEYDARRTAILNGMGISVIRFTNEQVLHFMTNVLREIELVVDREDVS